MTRKIFKNPISNNNRPAAPSPRCTRKRLEVIGLALALVGGVCALVLSVFFPGPQWLPLQYTIKDATMLVLLAAMLSQMLRTSRSKTPPDN